MCVCVGGGGGGGGGVGVLPWDSTLGMWCYDLIELPGVMNMIIV